MDHNEMRAMQHREETGYLPDEVYVPTAEDDPYDTEQAEIRAAVTEDYAATNRRRAAQRSRDRIAVLEQALADAGVEIPEH